jgi:hypothetical protein
MRRRLGFAGLVASLALATACNSGSSGPGDTLSDAEAHLSDLTEADISLELTASTDETEPVGFRVEGPFSFESDGDLPVLDLTYTRLLGSEEEQVTIESDGTTVTVDGEEVPEDRVGALRLGDGDVAGLEDLDLSDWVEDAEQTTDGGTTTVTGTLDGSAMLRDLNRITSEVAGAEGLAQLDDRTAAQLEKRITDSSIEVVTEGGGEHRFRSLQATIQFGKDVPSALKRVLGPYAAARIELRLRLR